MYGLRFMYGKLHCRKVYKNKFEECNTLPAKRTRKSGYRVYAVVSFVRQMFDGMPTGYKYKAFTVIHN